MFGKETDEARSHQEGLEPPFLAAAEKVAKDAHVEAAAETERRRKDLSQKLSASAAVEKEIRGVHASLKVPIAIISITFDTMCQCSSKLFCGGRMRNCFSWLQPPGPASILLPTSKTLPRNHRSHLCRKSFCKDPSNLGSRLKISHQPRRRR